jgi:hypothetical protein
MLVVICAEYIDTDIKRRWENDLSCANAVRRHIFFHVFSFSKMCSRVRSTSSRGVSLAIALQTHQLHSKYAPLGITTLISCRAGPQLSFFNTINKLHTNALRSALFHFYQPA